MKKLGFKEIVRESFRIYRLQFVKIVLLAVMIVVPLQFVSAMTNYMMYSNESISEIIDGYNAGTVSEEAATEWVSGNYVSKIFPYLCISAAVTLLSMVFSLALIQLVKDEGMHGVLSPNYHADETLVFYDNDTQVHDVGDASDYFALGMKKLPAFLGAFLIGVIITFFGLFMFLLPGIITGIVTAFLVYTIALSELKGFKSLLFTARVLTKAPVIFVYTICCEALYYMAEMVASSVLDKFISLGDPSILLKSVILACTEGVLVTVLSFLKIIPAVTFIGWSDIMELSEKMGDKEER